VTPGVLEQLRHSRRPLIAVVVVLIVLQALASGLASARAAVSASLLDAGVICHGAANGTGSGAESPADDSSGSGAVRDLCCVFCAAAAPALLTVTAPVVGHVERAGTDRLTLPARDHVLIAARAVRAGLSQAPPRFT